MVNAETFVIVEDTLCEGWLAWGESCGEVEIYQTEAEAQAELDYDFEMLNEARIDSGFEPDEEPSAFVVPLSEYIKGRKTIWTAREG